MSVRSAPLEGGRSQEVRQKLNEAGEHLASALKLLNSVNDVTHIEARLLECLEAIEDAAR